MKKLIFLMLIAPAVVAAQHKPADSLQRLIPHTQTDTQKVNVLNKLAVISINTQATQGLKYAREAFLLSSKIGYKKGLADAYLNSGRMLFSSNKADSAKANYKLAIKIYQQINDNTGLAQAYIRIGLVLRTEGLQSDALTYFQQASNICEKINDQEGTADCLILIANNFNQIREFDKALELYKKAYAIRVKINSKLKAAQALGGIGITYRNKQGAEPGNKNFKLAIQYMIKSRQLFIEYNHILNIAVIDKEIGVTYQEHGEYKNALVYLLEAEERYKTIDNQLEHGSLYKTIARCYLNLKHYPQAKKYIDKGLAAAIAEKYQDHIVESYQTLYDYYKTLGNDKMSLQFHEKWMQEKDSLIKRTNFDKLSVLTTKYETEKKEQQINLLNKENTIQKFSIARQKTAIGITAGITIALLLFGALLYNRNKHKQKIALQQQMLKQQEHLTQAVIDAEEKERKRIASDLHDGVGQMFSAVKMNLSGLVERVQFLRDEDRFLAEKTVALVDESCKEVRVISHQMMPNNMLLRSGIASDVKSFLEKIDSERLKVNVETIGFKNRLESNVEIVLYRVIQETVNNVIKHAQATMLDIKLERDTAGIKVNITDNGIGFNTTLKEDFEGIGLKNIATRIEYLKGTVNYESLPGKGTSVKIWVPVN